LAVQLSSAREVEKMALQFSCQELREFSSRVFARQEETESEKVKNLHC
jgi:hypothetical protein